MSQGKCPVEGQGTWAFAQAVPEAWNALPPETHTAAPSPPACPCALTTMSSEASQGPLIKNEPCLPKRLMPFPCFITLPQHLPAFNTLFSFYFLNVCLPHKNMSSTPGGCLQLSRESPAPSAALTLRKYSQCLQYMSVERMRAGLPSEIALGLRSMLPTRSAAWPRLLTSWATHSEGGGKSLETLDFSMSRRQYGSESHGAVSYGPSKRCE